MIRLYKRMKDESAGVMVENVIVLPLVFAIIMFMVISAFLIYDRAVIESAACRGATYAAHCIADPNYAELVGQTGSLDVSDQSVSNMNFSSVGRNIQAYRYLTGGNNVEDVVEAEVKAIVSQTRVNWTSQENVTVKCTQDNKIIYQDVTVTVTASYSIPSWVRWFGLETEYNVEAEATLAAVDPDEFIRNADLVVDLITQIDNATGNHISKAIDSIKTMANKLLDWISMD